MQKFKLISTAVFLSGVVFCPMIYAQDAGTNSQFNQLSAQIKEVESTANSIANNTLLFGNEQTEIENFNYTIRSAANAVDALNNYEKLRQQKQINLKWDTPTGQFQSSQLASYHLFNANAEDSSNPVYLCRAAFLGANYGTTGTYPGQLNDSGCHISYGGFAFIAPKFQILVNNNTDNKNLLWMPIQKIRDIFQVPMPPAIFEKKLQPVPTAAFSTHAVYYYPSEYNSFYPLFRVDPLTQPVPVAGGYEGGRPVYICRAKYNNVMYPGKFVIYMGENSIGQSACDIPVNDKEIVVKDSYDLLTVISNNVSTIKK